MLSHHPANAGIHCRSHAKNAFLPRVIGCFRSGGFSSHCANVLQKDDLHISKTVHVQNHMTQPSKCNPDSALPMRGLSKRAQAQLAPKSYGQQPPKVSGRYYNEIPQALRTKGTL